MRCVASFSELRAPDVSRFGGKAVQLAILSQQGLPVPAGFALAFAAGHPCELAPEEASAVRDAYAALGAGGEAVAVRSSAAEEDSQTASFAGQHATVLDARGADAVLAAVVACLESQGSERAQAYRRSAGIAKGGMGVLVQRMVAARWAGVCFTRAPGDPEQLVVEVVKGLGGALAAGAARPTRVALERQALGVAALDDDAELIEAFTIERAREVAREALRAEEALGCPVDFEWAWSEEGVAVLQARPITAGDDRAALERARSDEIERLRTLAGERLLVWSDFGTLDMFPQPAPLDLEIVELLSGPGGSFERAMARLGLRYPDLAPSGGLFAEVAGRAYLELTGLVRSVDDLPLALDLDGLPEGGAAIDPERLPIRIARPYWRSAARLFAALPRFVRAAFRFSRLRRRFDLVFRQTISPAVTREAAALRDEAWDELDGAQLYLRFRRAVDRFVELHVNHQMTDSITVPTHVVLQAVLRRLYGDEADAAEVRLTTGLPGNWNTETNLDLARLSAGDLSLEAFLGRYGHRGNPDYQVSAPRWREQPERVAALAEAVARAPVDPTEQLRRQAALRADAEARFARDLRAHRWLRWSRRRILRELEFYQRYSPTREATQGLCYLFVELARRALLEAARRHDLGDRIFHLSLDDLERVFTQGPSAAQRARASAECERLRLLRRLYVPHLVRSDQLEVIGRAPAIDAHARTIDGQVVSAGVVRGRARVVSGLGEARGLAAGEILVTASADPSWTPLFLVAGGVVLEAGGLLSHPAIVAREYGLPAVINVAHATRRIRTGDEITLDADAGRVILHGS